MIQSVSVHDEVLVNTRKWRDIPLGLESMRTEQLIVV